jgi:rSAM/selenodomain-associated transferase 2
MISVIVPAMNEAINLEPCLASLRSARHSVEVIVVRSRDTDWEISVGSDGVRTVRSSIPGRGAAIDAGIAAAQGEIVAFVHADSRLPDGAYDDMTGVMRNPKNVGGWFRRRLDDPRWRYRLVDLGANSFSRFCCIATGDQAIFCRRSVLLAVTPLKDYPLFEDMTLCRRLKKHGCLIQLPGPILVSPRRFHERGILRTIATNLHLTWAYFRGRDPAILYRSYYGDKPSGNSA